LEAAAGTVVADMASAVDTALPLGVAAGMVASEAWLAGAALHTAEAALPAGVGGAALQLLVGAGAVLRLLAEAEAALRLLAGTPRRARLCCCLPDPRLLQRLKTALRTCGSLHRG